MSRDYYLVERLAYSAPAVDANSQCRLREFILTRFPEVDIQRVESVQKKFLYAAFRIRKAQLSLSFPASTEELIHATSASNVNSILKSNLDWRRVTRTKYGKGSSFSKDARYANKYCNNKNGPNRVFIIFDVLVGKIEPVHPNNDSVPYVYWVDTYRSVDKKVIVKFDDFTFYPKCVIYYTTRSAMYNAPVERNVSFNRRRTVYGSSSVNVASEASYNSTNGGLRNSNPPQWTYAAIANPSSAPTVSTSSISSSTSVNRAGLRISNPERSSASGSSSYCSFHTSSNPPRRIPAATVKPRASLLDDCTIL